MSSATTPTEAAYMNVARQALFDALDEHDARCPIGDGCLVRANMLAFLAHCIGASREDVTAFPAMLADYDMKCVQAGGCEIDKPKSLVFGETGASGRYSHDNAYCIWPDRGDWRASYMPPDGHAVMLGTFDDEAAAESACNRHNRGNK
jgi:hypothetical protein